jgi:hypothetical protein
MSSHGKKTIGTTRHHRDAAKTLLEVAPKKTSGQNKPQSMHDCATFKAALRNAGIYLSEKKASITIIAIGDALNTIYLNDRPATHIDFFNDNLTPDELKLLSDAAKEAVKCDPTLDNSWLNNRSSVFMSQDLRRMLTRQALQVREPEVIIRPLKRGGLTVIAPPWEYVFCCQVQRLVDNNVRDLRHHDVKYAVTIMAWYLQKYGMPKLDPATVQQWFSQYSLRWSKTTEEKVKLVQAGHMVRF